MRLLLRALLVLTGRSSAPPPPVAAAAPSRLRHRFNVCARFAGVGIMKVYYEPRASYYFKSSLIMHAADDVIFMLMTMLALVDPVGRDQQGQPAY